MEARLRDDAHPVREAGGLLLQGRIDADEQDVVQQRVFLQQRPHPAAAAQYRPEGGRLHVRMVVEQDQAIGFMRRVQAGKVVVVPRVYPADESRSATLQPPAEKRLRLGVTVAGRSRNIPAIQDGSGQFPVIFQLRIGFRQQTDKRSLQFLLKS